MSLLTILQDAADRLGVVRPASAIGSSDQQTLRLLGMAQAEGKTLARRHPWQSITRLKTFTGVAASIQTDALPDDFDRFVPETFWNRTQKRFVNGPLSPQAWQAIQAKDIPPVSDAFRLSTGNILITPNPVTTDTYAYEFVSLKWCTTADGATRQAAWTADDDVGLLDEELMTIGVVWRFKKTQGFNYSEEFRNYEIEVTQLMARDGGSRTLRMGSDIDVTRPFVPTFSDSSWPL